MAADSTYPPIQPGDLVEARCPTGVQPLVKEGQIWPADAVTGPNAAPNAPKPLLTIVRVEDNVAYLGPLRGGEYSGDLDCGDGSKASFRYSLTQPDPNKLPEHNGVLAASTLGYPLWLWFAILGALLLIGGSVWGAWRWWKNRNQPRKKKLKVAPPPPLPPDEALKGFLREAEKAKWAESGEPKIARDLYARGYDLLRAYLELKLAMSAGSETTREFVGSFKAALAYHPQFQAGLPQGPGLIESLLVQADQVRFAGEMPDPELRRGFLASLQQVFDAFVVAPPAMPSAKAGKPPASPKRGAPP